MKKEENKKQPQNSKNFEKERKRNQKDDSSTLFSLCFNTCAAASEIFKISLLLVFFFLL